MPVIIRDLDILYGLFLTVQLFLQWENPLYKLRPVAYPREDGGAGSEFPLLKNMGHKTFPISFKINGREGVSRMLCSAKRCERHGGCET